jgi:hypothetical protein
MPPLLRLASARSFRPVRTVLRAGQNAPDLLPDYEASVGSMQCSRMRNPFLSC